eukprot:3505273-Rhodomonas_salina.1
MRSGGREGVVRLWDPGGDSEGGVRGAGAADGGEAAQGADEAEGRRSPSPLPLPTLPSLRARDLTEPGGCGGAGAMSVGKLELMIDMLELQIPEGATADLVHAFKDKDRITFHDLLTLLTSDDMVSSTDASLLTREARQKRERRCLLPPGSARLLGVGGADGGCGAGEADGGESEGGAVPAQGHGEPRPQVQGPRSLLLPQQVLLPPPTCPPSRLCCARGPGAADAGRGAAGASSGDVFILDGTHFLFLWVAPPRSLLPRASSSPLTRLRRSAPRPTRMSSRQVPYRPTPPLCRPRAHTPAHYAMSGTNLGLRYSTWGHFRSVTARREGGIGSGRWGSED